MSTSTEFGRRQKAKSEGRADTILRLLQDGPFLSSQVKLSNHRFSACVHSLRERGYRIEREELQNNDFRWTLVGYDEMVKVTDTMKEAYYKSPHWQAKRSERLRYDDNRCVNCHAWTRLHVHHWQYDLFAEELFHIWTLCEVCHEYIHNNPKVLIHFPHYVTPEIAALLTSTN